MERTWLRGLQSLVLVGAVVLAAAPAVSAGGKPTAVSGSGVDATVLLIFAFVYVGMILGEIPGLALERALAFIRERRTGL